MLPFAAEAIGPFFFLQRGTMSQTGDGETSVTANVYPSRRWRLQDNRKNKRLRSNRCQPGLVVSVKKSFSWIFKVTPELVDHP